MTMQTQQRESTGPAEAPAASSKGRRGVQAAVGGLVLALALGALGAVMRSNAEFAEANVSRQLAEQRIHFKPVDKLTPEERRTPCLVKHAGAPLTTGRQAECYANQFIGKHLKSIADGKTYSELREVQTSLRAQVAQAQAANDPAAADLQRQLTEATSKRQSLFEGETVRGLLLTSYGFSTLGAKADQAADVANVAGGAVLVLSLLVLAGTAVRRRGSV